MLSFFLTLDAPVARFAKADTLFSDHGAPLLEGRVPLGLGLVGVPGPAPGDGQGRRLRDDDCEAVASKLTAGVDLGASVMSDRLGRNVAGGSFGPVILS